MLTLSVLTFLFTLPRCQVIFQWKQTKEKLGNALSAWRNVRVDLTWQMSNICQFFLNTFNFRYNCTPGQLNNERGGELHEIKGSQDKTEIDKEHDKE